MDILASADPFAAISALPALLRRLLTEVQRRREEQRLALLLDEIGHPGLIADFDRVSRG